MHSTKTIVVSIIIPVFNEEKTVGELFSRVKRAKLPPFFKKEIVIVNDASTDNTPAVLLGARAKIVSHPQNLGKGAAIITGIEYSSGDLILIQDADLEYDPNAYIELLKPFGDSKTKAVFGSRLINYPLILTGQNRTPLPFHLLANKFLTFLTNILYGYRLTDMETGYKVFSRALVSKMRLKSSRFDIEPEITAKLLRLGVKIIEVPITVKPRGYSDGKKIGWYDGVMAIWSLLKYKIIN